MAPLPRPLLTTATTLLFTLFITLCSSSNSTYETATVYYSAETAKYTIKYGILDVRDGVAYGTYNRSQNITGWAILNVATSTASQDIADGVKMRAAGIVEGALTHKDIYDNYRSQYEFWLRYAPSKAINEAKEFYSEQRTWMEKMIIANQASDKTWYYIGLLYEQYQGMIEGYSAAASPDQSIDMFGFDFLCGTGDWLDIQNFVDGNDYFRKKMAGYPNGHCSVLFKVLPGYEDIFAAHSSWYIYSSMLRIYKHYSFACTDTRAVCIKMSFSSYPGFLSSLDDFYIMDSQLIMLQTTNPIYNRSLYSKATPHALLAWHRVRLANWLADNGRDWAEYIRQYNSGTYNNQYMVLDMKKIQLQKRIEDDAFWVVEQIPGLVEAEDETAILREGYWASYNVPFFTNISRMSGVPDAVDKYGPERSHDLAPRAKIFRRDQGTVHDLESMQAIMRYNGFKEGDPYADGSPDNAICSREDLLEHSRAGGCTDTKITDYFLAKEMTAVIMNGPTHTNGLPIFAWDNITGPIPHYGQPNIFDFDWDVQSPENMAN